MRSELVKPLIICGIVGCLGGAVTTTVGMASLATGIVLGGGYGLLFALLASNRVTTPGSGLLWGLAYALLLWLTSPTGLFAVVMGDTAARMFDTARTQFPSLVATLLCYGLPLGGTLGAARSLAARPEATPFSFPRTPPRISYSARICSPGTALFA